MKIEKVQANRKIFNPRTNQNKAPAPPKEVHPKIGAETNNPDAENSGKTVTEKDPQLGPTSFDEVAERAGIATAKSSNGIQGPDSFLTPQTQLMLDNYSGLIKNGLAMQVGQQMYVKLYQTGLDTFLMAEKWKYEQFTTILQFSQTVAQMMVGSMLTMRTQWEKMWTQVRQQQGQIHDALIKLYTQP